MKLSIAVLGFILTIAAAVYASGDAKERMILNAFSEQDMGVPEWIEINWSNEYKSGSAHQIQYGLGGRTCNSIVQFNAEGHMEELGRKCGF